MNQIQITFTRKLLIKTQPEQKNKCILVILTEFRIYMGKYTHSILSLPYNYTQ